MLFRRDSFRDVGGLDEQLGWVFDLHLLLKLRRHGPIRAVRHVVASYRWHEDALTVDSRKESVQQASTVRVRHLSPLARRLSGLLEPVVRTLMRSSAQLVGRKAGRDCDCLKFYLPDCLC